MLFASIWKKPYLVDGSAEDYSECLQVKSVEVISRRGDDFCVNPIYDLYAMFHSNWNNYSFHFLE